MRQLCVACERLEPRRLLSLVDLVTTGFRAGGTEYDYAGGMALAADGNLIIAGGEVVGDFEISHGYVAKYTPSGERLWQTKIGVGTDLVVTSVAAAADSNMFVTGYERGTLYQGRAYVAKLSTSGEIVWTIRLDGSGFDRAIDVAVGEDGSALVLGETSSENLPGATNAYHGGVADAFISKISASGEVLWCTYLGGTGRERVGGVAERLGGLSLDTAGNPVVVGETTSGDLADGFAGSSSGFIASFGPSGDLDSVNYIAATENDWTAIVAVGAEGQIYVGGWSYVAQVTRGGDVVWRLDIDAHAGPGRVTISDILPAPDGSLLLSGTESQVSDPVTGAMLRSSNGFLAHVSSTGSLKRTLRIGGGGADNAVGLILLNQKAVVFGSTVSPDFPEGAGEPQGLRDLFVMTADGLFGPPEKATVQPEATGTANDDEIRISSTGISIGDQFSPAVIITINGIAGQAFIPTAPIEIHALAGNDLITVDPAITFPVILHGGDGDDTLTGGSGDDLIYGGAGHDLITGGAGNDTLYGNFGSDTILAGMGDDQVFGGLGRDVIIGGAGNDTLLGGNGADLLRGGDGNDVLNGKGKPDTLYGGDGNDTLTGGAGADQLFGEGGDDLIQAAGDGLFQDTLIGGAGHDRYTADENDILIELEELL